MTKRLVWDLPLRLFHWLFALSIGAAWATAKAGYDWMQVHFYIGYWIIGLLLFRIVWGFIGPRHARFSSFLETPPAVWRYARRLFDRHSPPSVGHNPLGGLMVLVMLLLVALQSATGLFCTDDVIWSGPYNASVSKATASVLSSVHSGNFNFILAAVALHVLAIFYYRVFKKQSLVSSMFTGYKPAALVPEHEAIRSSQLLKAIVVSALSAGIVYWIVVSAPPAIDNLY
jgi:cytochrome b